MAQPTAPAAPSAGVETGNLPAPRLPDGAGCIWKSSQQSCCTSSSFGNRQVTLDRYPVGNRVGIGAVGDGTSPKLLKLLRGRIPGHSDVVPDTGEPRRFNRLKSEESVQVEIGVDLDLSSKALRHMR